MNTSKWLVLFCLFVTAASHGAIQKATKEEIQHLLSYVKSTDCQYERNGTQHTGVEAVAHIQKKYDYYVDDIKTAEDFIEYSATQSKMSGNKYKVHCTGLAKQTSQNWLLKELHKYRKSNKAGI